MTSSGWWKDPAELIPEQSAILDYDDDENLLIQGPPGSGKTNLLLLRANQLYINGKPNLHVVVFGSVLREFIRIGGVEYKFPAEKVITHARLFSQIIRENDAPFEANGKPLTEAREIRLSGMEWLIETGKVGQMFDAILLDEAQDYSPREIRIFRSLTSRLTAAADTRQKIFPVDDCSKDLTALLPNKHPLKYHFRNGREICKLADKVMAGKPDYVSLLKYSNYDEAAYPSKVFPRAGLSLGDQVAAIVSQVTDQRLAYPQDLIGILCPTLSDLNAVAELLSKSALADDLTVCGSEQFDPTRSVWLSTMSSAKGLEFRALHICALDSLKRMGDIQKRLAYTAITRAKSAVSMYYEKGVPGYLDAALRQFAAPAKAATKQQIFGKV